jgi:hypothetical protein
MAIQGLYLFAMGLEIGKSMKWNEMKNEMKWNEMKWNEMKWNEMKWKNWRMKWNERIEEWNEIEYETIPRLYSIVSTVNLPYVTIQFVVSLSCG